MASEQDPIYRACSRLTDASPLTLCQIDRLNLESYTNLEHWVQLLDARIEAILLVRLTRVIQAWCAQFGVVNEEGQEVRREVPGKRKGDKRKDAERVRFSERSS